MKMISFKRHYVFLALLILAGLGIALSTLAGLDTRIGWIAAGFTIGAQVAVHTLRSAEVRFAKLVESFNNEIGERQLVTSSVSAPVPVSPVDAPLSGERHVLSPSDTQASPADNVIALNPIETVDAVPEVALVEQPVSRTPGQCACACGCAENANGGFEGLCATCRRSRLQEALECECDLARNAACACGVMTHQPMTVDADLVAAG